jgi:hypothetical protein
LRAELYDVLTRWYVNILMRLCPREDFM